MKAIKKYETVLAVFVCFFLILFPFVTGFHVEELSGLAEEYFAKKSGYEIDLFQYWKEIVLVVFSVFLLILLVLGAVLSFIIEEIIPERYRIDRRTAVLILLFFLLNVLSCASGEYPEYCIWGLFLDYEGLAAITGYVILFAAGYFLLGTEQGMKMILISLRILALLVIIGCCAECVSGPVFNIEGIARILTPNRYEHLLEEVFLDYNGSVSLTFSNPGYFGGFCALLFPILYGSGITGDKRCLRVCDSALAGGLLFCLIMSGSSAAFYAATVSAGVETAVLFYRERNRGKYRSILICLAVFGLIALLMGKTQIMEGEGITARVGGSVVNSQYEEDSVFPVDRIRLESGILVVDSGDRRLEVQVLSDNSDMTLDDICFRDENGNRIPVVTDMPEGTHLTGKYELVGVTVMNRILNIDFGYRDPLEFYCIDGMLKYVSFNGDFLDTIPQPEVENLNFLYPLFTGRGYIWVSSLPLVRECLLLGKGIGSFPFFYPQSEVAGMLNVHGSADYCIEIAHSWYLQTVINSGLFSLLCMLGIFYIHFVEGLKVYVKKDGNSSAMPNNVKEIGTGLFFGILSFQIAGIVNNSTVATGPQFWILFGAGMGFLFHIGNCNKRSNGLQGKQF